MANENYILVVHVQKMLKRKLENEAESSGASDGEKFIDQSGLPSPGPGSSPLPASGLSLVAMVDNHPPRKLMKKNSKECFFFGFFQNHKCYLEIDYK